MALKDIVKIELISAGAWIDGYYRHVEVLPENGQWTSYQLRLYDQGRFGPHGRPAVKDSIRRFLRTVSADTVGRFLTMLSKPDTTFNYASFGIDRDKLKAYIDTNTAHLSPEEKKAIATDPEWKNEFVRASTSVPVIKKAIYNLLHPFLMDDRRNYYIILTDRSNRTDTVTADAAYELYNLPWRIRNKNSYDPNITRLFELMSGTYAYTRIEQQSLYMGLISHLYFNNGFKDKLLWAKFRQEHPEMYSQINKTLDPLMFGKYENFGYVGNFLSTRLPGFLQINCSFLIEHKSSIDFYNKKEERLVTWFKKDNFLFKYMAAHPYASMIFNNGDLKEKIMPELQKRYPQIAQFDQAQINVFFILENSDFYNASYWLLLPNDDVILIRYGGQLAGNYQQNFALVPAKRYHWSTKYVCMVFDRTGKQIAGNDEPIIMKKDQ